MQKHNIVFKGKSAQKGWKQICQEDIASAQECWEWLSHTPQRRHPSGRVSVFRNHRKQGLMGYHIGNHDYVFYKVDKKANLVVIVYAGPHP